MATQAPVVPAADAGGQVDVEAIIAKVNIDPKFKAIYDKAVLSGMMLMSNKRTHQMMEEQLAKPGPMADKISEGIIALIYMIWMRSNKTLPPQIIVPITFTLTLKAFDFLQKSGDPEATKEVLGEAIEKATTGILSKFGVSPEKMQEIIAQQKGNVAGAPAPTAPGLLAQGGP